MSTTGSCQSRVNDHSIRTTIRHTSAAGLRPASIDAKGLRQFDARAPQPANPRLWEKLPEFVSVHAIAIPCIAQVHQDSDHQETPTHAQAPANQHLSCIVSLGPDPLRRPIEGFRGGPKNRPLVFSAAHERHGRKPRCHDAQRDGWIDSIHCWKAASNAHRAGRQHPPLRGPEVIAKALPL